MSNIHNKEECTLGTFQPRRPSSAEETEDDGERGPINVQTKTDDIVTESESGRKWVKNCKNGQETVMEKEGTAVCQGVPYLS